MTPQEILGHQRVMEAVQSRESVLPVLRALIADCERQAGAEIFGGAVSACLGLMLVARNNGAKLSSPDPRADTILKTPLSQVAIDIQRQHATHDYFGLVETLRAVSGAIDTLARGKHARLLKPKEAPVADGFKRGRATGDGGPLKVEIVSQTARVTTTRVERNSSGEIVSTFHLEEDALKPDGQA
jgi:hypothetical protein